MMGGETTRHLTSYPNIHTLLHTASCIGSFLFFEQITR